MTNEGVKKMRLEVLNFFRPIIVINFLEYIQQGLPCYD